MAYGIFRLSSPSTENINEGDCIILVMGQPKVGKTSFIKSVMGEGSSKGEMKGVPHFISQWEDSSPRKVVLARLSLEYRTVEERLLTWLQNLSANGLTLSGILHLHPIGDDITSVARIRRMLRNAFDDTGRGTGDPPTRTMLIATKKDSLEALSEGVRKSWLDAWAGPGAVLILPEFDVTSGDSRNAREIVSILMNPRAAEETNVTANPMVAGNIKGKAKQGTDITKLPRAGNDEEELQYALEQLVKDREQLEKTLEEHGAAASEERNKLEEESQRHIEKLEENFGRLQQTLHWLTAELDDPQKIQELESRVNELKNENEKERREYERKLEKQSGRAEKGPQELQRRIERFRHEEKRLLYELSRAREGLSEQTTEHLRVQRLEDLLREANEREKREQKLRDIEVQRLEDLLREANEAERRERRIRDTLEEETRGARLREAQEREMREAMVEEYRKLTDHHVHAERERQELQRRLEESRQKEERMLYELGRVKEDLQEGAAKHLTVQRLEGLLRDANEREKREQRMRDLEAEDARLARQREAEERGRREAAEEQLREKDRIILEYQQEINRKLKATIGP